MSTKRCHPAMPKLRSQETEKPSAWLLGATHSIPRRRIRGRNVSVSNLC